MRTEEQPPSEGSVAPDAIEPDLSSSQSSLPIINVSNAEDYNELEDLKRHQAEQEEQPAEASCPEEQTLSRENIPGVIKKLSMQSEEQLLHDEDETESASVPNDDDEQDTPSDISGGYVPPAPTPAPSMAPLAEIEADEELQEVPQHIEAEVVQVPPPAAEYAEHHHKKRKKKREANREQVVRGNPVCPWDDE